NYYAMVFDGTQSGDSNRLKGYVDGVQQSLSFGVGAIPATLGNGGNFNIGRDPYLTSFGPGYYSLGSIADVQVYNRALSGSEISQIKTAPGAVTSGLIGFWPLSSASSGPDYSGQNNNGTVYGATISASAPSVTILNAGTNALTLTARTGSIQGSGAGTDINASSLTATAVTGIGSSTQLATQTTTLSATTSGAGAAAINIAH